MPLPQINSLDVKLSKKNSIRIFESGEYIVTCPDNGQHGGVTGEVTIKDRRTNAIVFEGMMLDSQKCGYGVEYDEKGNIIYQGEFKDNKRDGWGRTKEYQGEFRDGDFDGWGRFVNEERLYEGYFTNGNYNGIGIYLKSVESFSNIGQIQEQTKIQDFLQHEMGKDSVGFFNKFNIQEVYIGQWSKGLKNGSGKMWKPNGFWFSGQFAYDTIHGTGALHRSSELGVQKGIFYKGEFRGNFEQKS